MFQWGIRLERREEAVLVWLRGVSRKIDSRHFREVNSKWQALRRRLASTTDLAKEHLLVNIINNRNASSLEFLQYSDAACTTLHSLFQFQWFKDGQPLREGNRYTTKYDIPSRVLTLQILTARPDDQGTYTVRATNPVGKDETSCKLTIRPTPSIDTRPFVAPEKFGPLEIKAPPPSKEDMQKMEPPKVIVPLEDANLKEGVPALLTAKIIGRPTPDVSIDLYPIKSHNWCFHHGSSFGWKMISHWMPRVVCARAMTTVRNRCCCRSAISVPTMWVPIVSSPRIRRAKTRQHASWISSQISVVRSNNPRQNQKDFWSWNRSHWCQNRWTKW